MVLELSSQKGVKNGVDAEIKASDVRGDVLGVRKHTAALVRISVLVDHEYDVIRAPEREKHQDYHEDEAYRAMFPDHPRGHDCSRDPEVAVDEHHQREDEEQNELLVDAEDFPRGFARVFAHEPVLRILFDGEIDDGIEASEKANAPDH